MYSRYSRSGQLVEGRRTRSGGGSFLVGRRDGGGRVLLLRDQLSDLLRVGERPSL